ncbi:MAG TPA: hypothetical protein VF594_11930, partial [Rubricoccaceae bacterium]
TPPASLSPDNRAPENLAPSEAEVLSMSATPTVQRPTGDAGAPAVLTPRERLELEGFEDRLREAVASQVAIRHRADGAGKIEIAYYSTADLERVMDRLLGP